MYSQCGEIGNEGVQINYCMASIRFANTVRVCWSFFFSFPFLFFSLSSPTPQPQQYLQPFKSRYFFQGTVSCWDCIALVMNEYLRGFGGMILRRQFRNTPRRTYPSANSSTPNPTLTDVRSNPDLRGDKPTTKLLSHIYLDCGHAGIYRNYHKTMNILDRFSMIWSVYWSIRPGGRAFDYLLCLIVHSRHVPSAERMLYAVRTRYSQFLVTSPMFLLLSVQQSASHRMFLGALTKLRKATIRFIMSDCPSDRKEQLVSHWTDFIKFDFEHFSKICQEI